MLKCYYHYGHLLSMLSKFTIFFAIFFTTTPLIRVWGYVVGRVYVVTLYKVLVSVMIMGKRYFLSRYRYDRLERGRRNDRLTHGGKVFIILTPLKNLIGPVVHATSLGE